MAPKLITKMLVKPLNSGHDMPSIALGTFAFSFDPEEAKAAIIEAIKIGYWHFDTAAQYGSERTLGHAVAEAVRLGLITSRADVFVTSKIWCTDNHPELVIPAIKTSLSNLKMEYLDMYLIHWPISLKPGPIACPLKREEVMPLNLKGVWRAMEECQKLGLTRSIGVSNFTTNKLEELLQFAAIPPAVNQVEMNPSWQQIKLKECCAEKGVTVTAYCPLGGPTNFNPNTVLTSEELKEIADAKGKTVAQISLRWIFEQGAAIVVKTFKKERLTENLEIFDWDLTKEEHAKISSIVQKKVLTTESILAPEGSLSLVEFADIDNVEFCCASTARGATHSRAASSPPPQSSSPALSAPTSASPLATPIWSQIPRAPVEHDLLSTELNALASICWLQLKMNRVPRIDYQANDRMGGVEVLEQLVCGVCEEREEEAPDGR